jgi:hypothetical protein
MWIKLDEHLPHHLAPQSFTESRDLPSRVRGALFAGKSDFDASIWVGILVSRHIEVLVCRSTTV